MYRVKDIDYDSSDYGVDASASADASANYSIQKAGAHGSLRCRQGNEFAWVDAGAGGHVHASHSSTRIDKHDAEVGGSVHTHYGAGVGRGGLSASYGARASADAIAGGEIRGNLARGYARVGAQAEAAASVLGIAHGKAKTKNGAWARGHAGLHYDADKDETSLQWGGKTGTGARQQVESHLGNERIGAALKPKVGCAEVTFDPRLKLNHREESLGVSIALGACLGAGVETEARAKLYNPVNRETREGLADGDGKHIARVVNPSSLLTRGLMGEPKNDAEEVVAHIPVVGQVMAVGRVFDWW